MDQEAWEHKKQDVFEKMYAKARDFGGLVSGEHGIGYAKRMYLDEQCGPCQMRLMEGIKKTFDPHCILNPGKIVALHGK